MNVPIAFTLFRIALIPVFVVAFYLPLRWANEICAIAFALAAVTDWLDGFLARRLKQTTIFGAFLDPVADKLMVAVGPRAARPGQPRDLGRAPRRHHHRARDRDLGPPRVDGAHRRAPAGLGGHDGQVQDLLPTGGHRSHAVRIGGGSRGVSTGGGWPSCTWPPHSPSGRWCSTSSRPVSSCARRPDSRNRTGRACRLLRRDRRQGGVARGGSPLEWHAARA